jgi:thymidylate kinase
MSTSFQKKPLRVSVIGIDGAGKSSTTLRAILRLGSDFSVCKPGRDPFALRNGQITYCMPRISRFFESFFKYVDATKKRSWIGMSRILFVLYQGWLEPYMIRKYGPDLVINTRCMIIDPAIYSHLYYPWLGNRLSLKQKLQVARFLSRLPFRDLYIFLNTPAQIAMERIYKRIAKEPGYESQSREYWLHLHEQEVILNQLGERFRETLIVAQKMVPFKVIEIDTSQHPEEEVAERINQQVRIFYQNLLTSFNY